MADAQAATQEVENQERITVKELALACPSCDTLCFDIEMARKPDGKFWTDDTCWNCKAQLPMASLRR